jgi:mono/diheme cytochrome c family protein
LIRRIPLLFLIFTVSTLAVAQGSGDSLFMAKCSTCHGKDGMGKTAFAQKARIPDLASAEVQSLTDTEIHESIARGTKHKAYPHAFALRGMSESEINSLVKRIREFRKK